MRRLAPMFVMASIVALAGTSAFAMTGTSTSSGTANTYANPGNPDRTAAGVNAANKAIEAPPSSTKSDSTAAMNDAESKPTASMDDSTKAKAKKTKARKHVASNAGKTSANPPVDANNGQAVGSLTGQSGGDSSSGSSGSAGSSGSSSSGSSSK